VEVSRRKLLATSVSALLAPTLASAAAQGASASAGPHVNLRRLAWAGVRLDLANVTLFIDAITPDPDSGQPGPPLTPGGPHTYALVTHHHDDHCDLKALAPLLGESGYLVCYQGSVPFIDQRPVRMHPVPLYEPVFLSRAGGEFAAFAVPAVDGLGTPQVSWVVDAGGRRLIHCGDTLWHGYWWDIARAYGPFDAALLPVNGFRNPQGRFTDTGLPMGMTPEAAAAAAQILGARLAIPIHYGISGDPNYLEEPNALTRFTAAAQRKGVTVRVLQPGEELRLT
jgi:L-ascorbate metabolism protein UlaG (beta-lactamase superfamily)